MDARFGWFLLGAFIGFALGYVVSNLREIKERVDQVDKHVQERSKKDDGFVRNPLVMDITLILVVVLTVWAAISSQIASSGVKGNQDRIDRITACNQEYLGKTIIALNERTTYTQAQANANVALQSAQAAFLSLVLHHPQPSATDSERALRTYFDTLTNFVKVSGQSSEKTQSFPYPTLGELEICYAAQGKIPTTHPSQTK